MTYPGELLHDYSACTYIHGVTDLSLANFAEVLAFAYKRAGDTRIKIRLHPKLYANMLEYTKGTMFFLDIVMNPEAPTEYNCHFTEFYHMDNLIPHHVGELVAVLKTREW